MEFLRKALDDPAAEPCGRCDNCTGTAMPVELSGAAVAAARSHLGRPGVTVPPRRQWPTALAEASGKIPAGEVAETGRVLGRLSDLGWSDRLRRLVAPDAPDGPVPDDIVAAVVEVLKDWATGDDRWAVRPAGVVSIASGRHRTLVRSLAARIAEIGRLPLLGEVTVADGADTGRANSAYRVRALHARLSVDDVLAERVAGAGGPVLLVDDFIDTGWTMAIAARQLRLAGAAGVLPLALAQAS
jgi:ATP-dependent DNA helicase RecQ